MNKIVISRPHGYSLSTNLHFSFFSLNKSMGQYVIINWVTHTQHTYMSSERRQLDTHLQTNSSRHRTSVRTSVRHRTEIQVMRSWSFKFDFQNFKTVKSLFYSDAKDVFIEYYASFYSEIWWMTVISLPSKWLIPNGEATNISWIKVTAIKNPTYPGCTYAQIH